MCVHMCLVCVFARAVGVAGVDCCVWSICLHDAHVVDCCCFVFGVCVLVCVLLLFVFVFVLLFVVLLSDFLFFFCFA